jgi:hypothetical protein
LVISSIIVAAPAAVAADPVVVTANNVGPGPQRDPVPGMRRIKMLFFPRPEQCRINQHFEISRETFDFGNNKINADQ